MAVGQPSSGKNTDAQTGRRIEIGGKILAHH
jgi:hypothetical protein